MPQQCRHDFDELLSIVLMCNNITICILSVTDIQTLPNANFTVNSPTTHPTTHHFQATSNDVKLKKVVTNAVRNFDAQSFDSGMFIQSDYFPQFGNIGNC